MSKNDLSSAINLIQQAIVACGHDFATADVRSHLLAALRAAGQVAKRRSRRETALAAATQKGLKSADMWWDQIQDNVRRAAVQLAAGQSVAKSEAAADTYPS